MSVLYPTVAIRNLIAETASDESLSADAKAREFALLKDDLKVLVGDIDRKLGEARKLAEAENLLQTERVLGLRENADLREELVRRGLADNERMDRLGYPTHEDIDGLVAREVGLEEASIGDLRRKWEELKHPRGRGGRFRDVPGHEMIGQHTKGGRVKRVLEDTKTGQKIPVFEGQPGPRSGGGPDAYEARRVAQEKRTSAVVSRRSRQAGVRSDPVNVLGRISQASLLKYLQETKTKPTTADLHSSVDPATGVRVWDADRAEIHERIVRAILNQRDENGDVCADCGEIPGHEWGDREVAFMGGGYAAGKGSVQDVLVLTGPGGLLHGAKPEDKGKTFLALDPDEIKAQLPEFQESADDDPETNLTVYEEAWHISQLVQKAAQARGVDVLVDGISNTSPDEVAKRMQSFVDSGFKPPKFYYVSVPTDVAVERAIERARTATKRSDKRYIPEQVMRAVHRDVSATVAAMMGDERFKDADISVYNTEIRGNPRLAAQKASGATGETVADAELWDTFRAKGLESVAGVHDDPQHVRYLQDLFTPEEKRVSETYPKQGWGSTREEAAAAVPPLQAAMESMLSEGVAQRLGAQVRGGNHPYDVHEIAMHSGIDVLIAPPKALDRAAAKVDRKWQGDWTRVPDLVRGSVVVDTEEDMGAAMDAIRAEATARGWHFADSDNKFVHVPESEVDTGPTVDGYKDLAIQVMTDSGNHFELQVHVRPMWAAKELGGPETGGLPGHDLYKRGQEIMDASRKQPEGLTDQQIEELGHLADIQTALYGSAAARARRVNNGQP